METVATRLVMEVGEIVGKEVALYVESLVGSPDSPELAVGEVEAHAEGVSVTTGL